jgi:predicted membrane-bound spermidine synthase
MSLCEYSDILGKPNEGMHSYSIFDLAIFDILGTFVIALLFAFIFLPNKIRSNFIVTFFFSLILMFIVAELLHYSFCVNTRFLNNYLGIKFNKE